MKLFSFALFIFLIAQPAFGADKKDAGAAAPATQAESPKTPLTICTSLVTYKWKRLPPTAPEDPLPGGRKGKGAAPPAASTPDPEIYGPIESAALSITESGEVESEVKARVEFQLPAALTRAMTLCAELHQNQGSCLTKKLGAVSTQLDRLDFETKKEIREQSVEDCEKENGVCISSSKSEITCRQEVLPTPAPTEAPATGAKDAKKK